MTDVLQASYTSSCPLGQRIVQLVRAYYQDDFKKITVEALCCILCYWLIATQSRKSHWSSGLAFKLHISGSLGQVQFIVNLCIV